LPTSRETPLRDPLAMYDRAIKDFVRPALEDAVKKLGPGFTIGRSLPLGPYSIGVAKTEWVESSKLVVWTSFHVCRVNDISVKFVRRVPGIQFPDLPCRIAALSESYFEEQLHTWVTIVLTRAGS
jgi:hypothetical protein